MEERTNEQLAATGDDNDPRMNFIRREQVAEGVGNMLAQLREYLLIYLEQFPPAKQFAILQRGSVNIEAAEDGSYIIITNRLRAEEPAMPPDPVMKFGRADYVSFDALARRIPDGEPVMIFRAQDENLPEVAEFYAGLVEQKGGDLSIANLSIQHANRVRDWQAANDTKSPDLERKESEL